MSEERKPISSLIGKKITDLSMPYATLNLIDEKGEVFATVNFDDLFDEDGNRFYNDN